MEATINNFSTLLDSMPPITREGLLVHTHRMANSSRALLLPRQLAYYIDHEDEQGNVNAPAGFVCGVSGRNLLPTVNFCQDIRAWRARLERHGIKVVKAASFSGRSTQDHQRYAKTVGYPVVLKPVIRNTLFEESVGNIGNEAELEFLFRKSRELKKNKASDIGASPYAMTRLSEEHVDEHGRHFLPLSVRYLVEKQLEGRLLRLILAEGKVVMALHKAPSEQDWYREEDLHDSYRELGEKIAGVMQGMAFLRVDLMVEDPNKAITKENHAVIALSEHIESYKLWRQHRELTHQLLAKVTGYDAEIALDEGMRIEAVLAGISREERLHHELIQTAQALGLELNIEEVDEVTGRVHFWASGASWAACALTWAYANGLGIDEVPTSVSIKVMN